MLDYEYRDKILAAQLWIRYDYLKICTYNKLRKYYILKHPDEIKHDNHIDGAMVHIRLQILGNMSRTVETSP